MKLYVGNVSFSSSDETLGALFGECGEVVSCHIVMDRETGRSRGFAFVEFANGEDGNAAIERFNGYEVDGRPLRVNEARPQQPRTGGGGGGFRGDRPRSGSYGGGGGGGRW
jgi:cold-inducible RNA-binding protein